MHIYYIGFNYLFVDLQNLSTLFQKSIKAIFVEHKIKTNGYWQ